MMNALGPDEPTHYDLLKTLEENPSLSQRDLANRLGISLGKVNFCLKALIGKGCIKVNNFRNSENKLAYAYLLTPRGVEEKANMTVTFLRYKMQEYERLQVEIDELRLEVRKNGMVEQNAEVGHVSQQALTPEAKVMITNRGFDRGDGDDGTNS